MENRQNSDQNVNHIKALLIKAMLVWPTVWVVLSVFNDVSFLDSTILGVIIVILAYFIGDLMILPKMGNVSATISDFVLSFIITWATLNFFGYDEALGEAVLTAIVISIGEYFYHRWLLDDQFGKTAHK
ncbi:DUF2512 family protein [Domibacillus epiphyticus]|uniref:DUF2512 domain-containing protein n=1 Tax=Domibacillus epiphyticus TaxID=1714355 RepID=A0A1V2ABC7_9BACI|nr:DUF2512 family protein [Domibacillus epiphyticus]OMP68303.1 hypothetical protein BTO28_02510 [Domibacillus epiphyticus]